MLPITFKESNFVYGKPEDMTDEQCMDLPVWKGNDGNGFSVIISCWKFNQDDLEEIKRTGCIYLAVTGNGMPPVGLYTENPWT